MTAFQRECGYCATLCTELARTTCARCGGELPPLPIGVARRHPELADVATREAFLAMAPPPPPRKPPLRWTIRRFLQLTRTFVGGLLALIFTIFGFVGCLTVFVLPPLGCPFLLLGLASVVGYGILLWGWLEARKAGIAWRTGEAIAARVLSVSEDHSAMNEGNHFPFRVAYAFETPSGTYQGSARIATERKDEYAVDDPLWVVYVPTDPSINGPWPPLQ